MKAILAAVLLALGGPAIAADAVDMATLGQKIRIGTTTSQEVTALLGKPLRVERFARRGVEAWDYRVLDWDKPVDVSIEINDKGVVSNVTQARRWGP